MEKGIESMPTMVKPNQDEIELLFHIKVRSREDVIEYAKKIYEKGIPYVVISLGGDGALLVCEKGIYQGKPPKIEVVNTVGCGDSMVGAFAVGLERHMEPEEALKFAVAVASANALSPLTGTFDTAKRDEIIKNVEIIKLSDPEREYNYVNDIKRNITESSGRRICSGCIQCRKHGDGTGSCGGSRGIALTGHHADNSVYRGICGT